METMFMVVGAIVFVGSFTISFLANRRPVPVSSDVLDILYRYMHYDKYRDCEEILSVPDGFDEAFLWPNDLWSIPTLRYGHGSQPILFVPGNSHCAQSLEDAMRALGQDFDVWAYSLAGTGRSTEDERYNQSLDTALQELEIVAKEIYKQTGRKPIAIGHSFGGYLVRIHPDKDDLFSGLVFLSSLEENGFTKRMLAAAWQKILDFFDFFHTKAEKFARQYYKWIAGSNATLEQIERHARSIRYEFQSRMIMQSTRKNEAPSGSELPTLFVGIYGDQTITPKDVLEDFNHVLLKFPNVELGMISGGHSIFDYQEFAKLMRNHFLSEEDDSSPEPTRDNVVTLR